MRILKTIIKAFFDLFDTSGVGFPAGNPKLYSELLGLTFNCPDKDSILDVEKRIKEEYDKAFNLTVFEYRELRNNIQKQRDKLGMGESPLEKDFWTKRREESGYNFP